VLVTGSGTIGLTALLAARAAGATRVVVSDVIESRLRHALEMGATSIVNSRDVSVPDFVRSATGGEGADVVIECSGARSAQADAIASARRGGVVVVVGLGRETLEVPLWRLIGHELDIRGVHRYTNTYAAAVGLVASGQINVKPLVTHHFGLADVGQAMETAHSDLERAIKVMVHPSTGGG
jgi:L-iditol 2-dehydrogenase